MIGEGESFWESKSKNSFIGIKNNIVKIAMDGNVIIRIFFGVKIIFDSYHGLAS